MSLGSAAVLFKHFSTGDGADDAAALRRLGVMFSLSSSLEDTRLVLGKRDIVDNRTAGRRRGRQRVAAGMLFV